MEIIRLKYNYFFLNATDGDLFKDNDEGYYYICAKDLESHPNVHLYSSLLKNENCFNRFLCKIHHSRKLNKIVRIPFKRIWYPKYYRFVIKDNAPICFVLNNFQLPFEYMLYLKHEYPNAKFVKIHRDLVKYFYDRYPSYSKQKCDEFFDLNFSYDRDEAEILGWEYFDEFESKIDISKNDCGQECDVFFAGRAKDRLPILLDVYRKLSSEGIKCNFYLTGVPAENRIRYPGIEYADKNLTYKEMLVRTINCKCVLDINQIGAKGFTSRFLEAIIYNKKLLTNNPFAKTSKFYNPNFIYCFDNPLTIDPVFIKREVNVDYKYNDEFSPIHLIEQIDVALQRIDEINK